MTNLRHNSIMLIVSIILNITTCPNCGAVLKSYECEYCCSVFAPIVDPGYRIPKPRPELLPEGLFEVNVGDTPYRVLGQLARGENSQVLLARRASAVTEQVVIKLGGPELKKEWEALRHLQGRRELLDCLLPHPIQLGTVRRHTALVYRWRSGFIYTLAFARQQYPAGIPPEATVWMWNRILDQLSCLKELGYSHGDLRLEHLLVHVRDHGIAFCGWGKARLGEQGDLEASARCIGELLGPGTPSPLLDLVYSAHLYNSPQHLKTQLKRVAEAAFGPPKYRPFALPRA